MGQVSTKTTTNNREIIGKILSHKTLRILQPVFHLNSFVTSTWTLLRVYLRLRFVIDANSYDPIFVCFIKWCKHQWYSFGLLLAIYEISYDSILYFLTSDATSYGVLLCLFWWVTQTVLIGLDMFLSKCCNQQRCSFRLIIIINANTYDCLRCFHIKWYKQLWFSFLFFCSKQYKQLRSSFPSLLV